VRAYSRQGHGPRAEQQAGYISATSDSTPSVAKGSRSIHLGHLHPFAASSATGCRAPIPDLPALAREQSEKLPSGAPCGFRARLHQLREALIPRGTNISNPASSGDESASGQVIPRERSQPSGRRPESAGPNKCGAPQVGSVRSATADAAAGEPVIPHCDSRSSSRHARPRAPMTISEAYAPSASPFSKSPALTAI
jgi:hypothetical protein